MKILILEQGAKERFLIEQTLQANGHQLVWAENAEQAWRLINAGDIRFVIADADSSDAITAGLVRRARVADISHIYFLILTAHRESPIEADDILHKPLKAFELKSRLAIGQRILSLGDHLSQARDQLENMAVYDSLTGMMNYAAFCKLAQGEVERVRRSAAPFSLIALKIDNFKIINDEYGMKAGEKLLQGISKSIRERSRPYDCIGRSTDAEFLISLPGVIGTDAEKIAERIISDVCASGVSVEDVVFDVKISGGIVAVSQISMTMDVKSLIEQAQQARMRAKETGEHEIWLTNIPA